MPPPPPNFLPANRRRRNLDPTRHLKSRELWNKVRFHASSPSVANNGNNNPPHSSSSPSSSFSSNANWAIALFQAILYEIQPFRIKPALHRVRIFVRDEDGLKQLVKSTMERAKSFLSLLRQLLQFLYQQLRKTDFDSVKSFFTDNKSLLTTSTVVIVSLRLYYHLVVYLHELLHIGPIMIIVTLLSLLYTIGLGDNTGAASGVPSAYSVFNRGMKRIMGTVDGEELARQYAGGAMMAGMNNNNNHHHRNNVVNEDDFDDEGVWVNNDDDGEESDGEEERNLVNERRRQRRLERLQQRNNDNDEGNDEIDDAVQLGEESANEGLNDGDAPDLAEDEQNRPDDQPTNDGIAEATARKSGKKARRRNLELRREMQRQRQAAAAMGFGAGAEGGGVNDAREREARMALE